MAAKEFDMQDFISIQPFWKLEMKNAVPLRDQSSRVVARLCDMISREDGLVCVPGIGLISIMFSKDPEHPSAYCCGTLEKGKVVPLYGAKSSFFCQFMPGEFTRIFGIPGSELTNLEVPLGDLMNAGTVAEEIANAASFQERAQVFLQFIYSVQPVRNQDTPRLVHYVMETVLRRNGDIRMKELEGQTGYSARYLQEILLTHVGLSPKRICSHARFQGALHLLDQNKKISLSDLTQQTGFYDQSHFTRVFKEYVGMSPLEFIKGYNQNKD